MATYKPGPMFTAHYLLKIRYEMAWNATATEWLEAFTAYRNSCRSIARIVTKIRRQQHG